MTRLSFFAVALVLALAGRSAAQTPPASAPVDVDAQAKRIAQQMTAAERVQLTHGIMALPGVGPVDIPKDAVPGAGYVAGVARLGIPPLKESDASLGVAYVGGAAA